MYIIIVLAFVFYPIVQAEYNLDPDMNGNTKEVQSNLLETNNPTKTESSNQPHLLLENSNSLRSKSAGTSHGGIQPHLLLESSNSPAAKASGALQDEAQPSSDLENCNCDVKDSHSISQSDASQSSKTGAVSYEPNKPLLTMESSDASQSSKTGAVSYEPNKPLLTMESSDASQSSKTGAVSYEPNKPLLTMESSDASHSESKDFKAGYEGSKPLLTMESSDPQGGKIEETNHVVTQQHFSESNDSSMGGASHAASKPQLFMESTDPEGPATMGEVKENRTAANRSESESKKKPNLFINKNNQAKGKSDEATPQEDKWTYKSGPNGPSHWAEIVGNQCGGKKQSPINLELGNFKTLNNLSKLTWSWHYKTLPTGMTIVNDGRTLKLMVKFEGDDTPTLEGGALKAPYNLEEIHFHWGKYDQRGSEHMINKRSFPMEMQIIHFGSNVYNKSTAFKVDKGVVIIGYLFEIDKSNNEAIENILTVIDILKVERDLPVDLSSVFKLGDLLDLFETDYVSYSGSFTTPPCYESVIWFVSPYTLSISHKQLEKFRQISSDNYRPLQPLNGRTVNFVHG